VVYTHYPNLLQKVALDICSFICQAPRPRDSEETFSVFESRLPPVTTSLTTQR